MYIQSDKLGLRSLRRTYYVHRSVETRCQFDREFRGMADQSSQHDAAMVVTMEQDQPNEPRTPGDAFHRIYAAQTFRVGDCKDV